MWCGYLTICIFALNFFLMRRYIIYWGEKNRSHLSSHYPPPPIHIYQYPLNKHIFLLSLNISVSLSLFFCIYIYIYPYSFPLSIYVSLFLFLSLSFSLSSHLKFSTSLLNHNFYFYPCKPPRQPVFLHPILSVAIQDCGASMYQCSVPV